MDYYEINITPRGTDTRREEKRLRRVGMLYHRILESGEPRQLGSYWAHFRTSPPRSNFKMDYTIESIANGFKSIFGTCLRTTSRYQGIIEFDFNGFIVVVENRGGSLRVNGDTMTRTTASRHLAALCFQTNDENTREEVRDKFFKIISLPPDVNYCIINRAPYSFYLDGQYIECRMNVRQISPKKLALEISEGVWGTLTVKQFMGYLSHYLHGTQRGSWCYTSPEVLYKRVMGEEGRESDIKVMKNFLAQNRTSDIVDRRAKVLLKETLEKYEDRVKYFSCTDTNQHNALFVKGTENDWVIYWVENNRNRTGRQLVSTMYHSPTSDKAKRLLFDFNCKGGENFKGVCVDNLQSNSPLIDQAVSRVLVCLNDKNTKRMVSTMQGIPLADKRIDFNSFRAKDSFVFFAFEKTSIKDKSKSVMEK